MLLIVCAMGMNAAMGQKTKIHGLVFGDAYWMAAHDKPSLENQNGLWFRRIYLTFDFSLSENWSARFRTELSSPGDFKTKGKMEPFAKDAYVRWKNGNHQVKVGLAGTPTWDTIEGFWGFRAVEKTLLDLQRIGSSRDMGVSAKGKLGTGGKITYNVMVGNGNGTSGETNEGKKGMLALGLQPSKAVTIEVYGDFDDRPGHTDRYTIQGFVGVKTDVGRIGLQYFYQRRDVVSGPNVDLNGLSVFGAYTVSPRVNGFLRFDRMFDANPDAGKIAYLPFSSEAKSNMILAGIDIHPNDQVHFMPNVEAVFYDTTNGVQPDATVMPRVTFFYTFK